jgi:hypothetical protein
MKIFIELNAFPFLSDTDKFDPRPLQTSHSSLLHIQIPTNFRIRNFKVPTSSPATSSFFCHIDCVSLQLFRQQTSLALVLPSLPASSILHFERRYSFFFQDRATCNYCFKLYPIIFRFQLRDPTRPTAALYPAPCRVDNGMLTLWDEEVWGNGRQERGRCGDASTSTNGDNRGMNRRTGAATSRTQWAQANVFLRFLFFSSN